LDKNTRKVANILQPHDPAIANRFYHHLLLT
jgi:hypothetical protein